MTNEEIVLERLKNPFLGKYPIHFDATNNLYYFHYVNSLDNYKQMLKDDIDILKSETSVKDRVYKILSMYRYPTYSIKNRFQCKPNARRSTADIWRIYKNYFGDTDIFSIMRALYELVYIDRKLSTIKCCTVRKQVFWIPEMEGYGRTIRDYLNSELGVNLKEWENIGLKEVDDEN